MMRKLVFFASEIDIEDFTLKLKQSVSDKGPVLEICVDKYLCLTNEVMIFIQNCMLFHTEIYI